MTLATKAELITEVKLALVRPGDTLLDPYMDRWILQVELRFNRERILRAMETVVTFTIPSTGSAPGRIALPSDFIECRSIRLSGLATPIAIEQLSAEMFTRSLADDVTTGQPKFFAVIGQEFNFWPKPDTSYAAEAVYWAKIAALTADTPNWLLTNAPDVYFFGMLAESAKDIEAPPEKLLVWETSYQAAVRSLMESDARGNDSPSADKPKYAPRGSYGGGSYGQPIQPPAVKVA